jgi:hypothetical protein
LRRPAAALVQVSRRKLFELDPRATDNQLRCEGREPPPELLDLYCKLGNAQRRFCEALGWQRVPRDLTPSISSYIQAAKPDADVNSD